MKQETKLQFIELRAKGYSYEKIAKRLGISKGTCTKWNRELSAEVARSKRIELDSLHESMRIHKEGRVKRLGKTLKRIERELGKRDLSEVPTTRLLEYALKYLDALKAETSEPPDNLETQNAPELNAKGLLEELARLYGDFRNGQVGANKAAQEQRLLASLLKAYGDTVIESKVDALRSALERGNG